MINRRELKGERSPEDHDQVRQQSLLHVIFILKRTQQPLLECCQLCNFIVFLMRSVQVETYQNAQNAVSYCAVYCCNLYKEQHELNSALSI